MINNILENFHTFKWEYLFKRFDLNVNNQYNHGIMTYTENFDIYLLTTKESLEKYFTDKELPSEIEIFIEIYGKNETLKYKNYQVINDEVAIKMIYHKILNCNKQTTDLITNDILNIKKHITDIK